MIDRAVHADPQTSRDRPLALDERSMRALELGLAGLSLVAALLLTIAR